MKKFFQKTGIAIGLIILINLAFYFFISKPVLFEKYIYNKNRIESYDIFLLGDSHPAALKKIPGENDIFNFAYHSDNYLDMYLKLKFLSKKISSKDTVLLTVDPHTLSFYREKSINLERNLIYAGEVFSDIKKEDLPERNIILKQKVLRYFPLLNVEYSKFYAQYLRPFHSLVPRDFSRLSDEEKRTKVKERYKSQFPSDKKSIHQEYYLEKIIELSRKKDFYLMGIKYPVSGMYLNLIKHRPTPSEELLRENNIPIIDLQAIFRKRDELFHDQDHLNEHGARIFCRILHEKL